MGARSYRTVLQDPRWQRKRLMVLQRSNWRCEWCGASDKSLEVHHGYYGKTDGKLREPWQIPSEVLWVLCSTCHDKAEVARQGLYLEIGRIHPKFHYQVRQLLQQVQEIIERNPDELRDAGVAADAVREDP